MATVPTGELEAKLRSLYLRWVRQLPDNPRNMQAHVDKFKKQSQALIAKEGGRVSRLGVAADFPAPKELVLDTVVGTIYDDLELAVIKQQITTGLNPRLSAGALKRKDMDKSFNRLIRLARTETVRAYWNNQWDEAAGLPDIVMLWGAENGPRTCEWCKERDGMVVPGRGVRDHPQGRCTLVPTLRSMVEYKGSLADDGTIYQDPAWAEPSSRATRVAAEEVEVTPELTSTPVDTPTPSYAPSKAVPRGPQPQTVAPTQPRVIKSVKDMESFGAGMPSPSSLTANAARVVDDYAKGTAYTANAVLRGQKTYRGRPIDARTKTYTKSFTKDMDKMMDASLTPEDVRVVRAVGADAFGGLDELQKLVGGVYRDKGYMSTSLADKVSSNIYDVKDAVEMEIIVPKGSRAVYMAGESYLKSERELLLDRGTNMAVQSVTFNERTKKWKLVATVVPGPR